MAGLPESYDGVVLMAGAQGVSEMYSSEQMKGKHCLGFSSLVTWKENDSDGLFPSVIG